MITKNFGFSNQFKHLSNNMLNHYSDSLEAYPNILVQIKPISVW